jgi:hypothetical protein
MIGIDQAVDPATVGSDGTVRLSGLGGFALDQPYGCYSYAYTLTGAAPDGTTVTVRHPVGDPAQSVLSRYAPSASTEVSTQLIDGAEAEVSDTIQVRDGVPGLPFTGTTTLYGPFTTNDEALTADLSGVEPVGSVAFGGVYGPDGTAVVTSPRVAVAELGFYVFVELLDATPASNPTPPGPAGRPPETTVLLQIDITSVLSAARSEPGSTVTDEVTLSGLVPLVGASPVTYQLRGGLYGPVPADSDQTCVGADWSDASMVLAITQTLAPTDIGDDGTMVLAELGPYTIPADRRGACYSYGYTLTATTPTGSTLTVDHAPGNPVQTTLVPLIEEPEPTTLIPGSIVAGESPASGPRPVSLLAALITMGGVYWAGRRLVARLETRGPSRDF